MDIALLEPEIPQNAGNIARTCAATGCNLHLIRPLGFKVQDKYLKRAGLDYWSLIDVKYYDSFDEFYNCFSDRNIFMATTKAKRVYTDVSYSSDSIILFGKESKGIPEEVLLRFPDSAVRIPMISESRSLNLANSVSVIVYEALRQQNFCGLELNGQLHRHTW